MDRLDILGKDLTALGNVNGGVIHLEFTAAHSLVRAVSDPVVASSACVFWPTWL